MTRIANFPVIRYFREAKEELKKVTWPSQKDALTYSAFVVVLSTIMAAYFGALDWVLTLALEAILKLTA